MPIMKFRPSFLWGRRTPNSVCIWCQRIKKGCGITCECGSEMYSIGSGQPAPKKQNRKAWRKIAAAVFRGKGCSPKMAEQEASKLYRQDG